MWKKFCIAILSIALLSGATFVGGLLSAAEESILQFIAEQNQDHYVGNEFSYTLNTNRGEEIIDISGGEIHGNGMMYQIPFDEEAVLRFADIQKPGSYQGEINAEVRDGTDGTIREIKGIISFQVYGIVYRNSEYEMKINETLLPETYGSLPQTLTNPIFTYQSDDPSIISVSEDGTVTALKEGTCQIHMVVYQGVQDEGHRLYESSATIAVIPQIEMKFNEEDALDGEANGYRFIQSQQVKANEEKEQKIGLFELAQSGEYTYQIEEEKQKDYEVRDGMLYVLQAQKEGTYEVKVYIISDDREHSYVVHCSYTVSAAEETATEDFKFRYEGKDTNGIIRPYQEGKNTFQITTNKTLDEVKFYLKNESDSIYLTVSQTGSVKIKQITEHPVTIVAKWHKQTYEINVVIEKSDQVLSCMQTDIAISLEDGAFDPLIEGRAGSGSLVGTISDHENVIELKYSDSGALSILPLAVGDATVEIYNDGDNNYKKSNVLTLHIHVHDRQVMSDEWIGDAKWLNIEGETGDNGWYVSPVTLSLKQSTNATNFQYQELSYDEMLWEENGESMLPLKFIAEDGTVSTPAKLSLQIDTHPPMITSITERKAADSTWKEWIDQLTFQKTFGNGMIVSIDASDELLNAQVLTSGVAEIQYRIYRMEEEQEVLLKEGIQTDTDHISVDIEDTGTHKVCASVQDRAGLVSDEVCEVLDAQVPKTALKAENSGMVLYGEQLSESNRFYVHEIDDAQLDIAAEFLQIDREKQAIIGYHLDWKKDIDDKNNQNIQAVIPMTTGDDKQITWYQEQEDGTLQPLELEKVDNAHVLQLQSLQDIYYVEEEISFPSASSDLHFTQSVQSSASTAQISTAVTKMALRPLTLAQEDMHILLIAGGSVIVACFIILLIRSGREEY